MKTLVQPPTDIRCVAYVAAMATGTSVEEFEAWATDHPISTRHTPPYEDLHFYSYCLSRGYICGYRFASITGRLPRLSIDQISFHIDAAIDGHPAYVVTKQSVDSRWNHCVYWDGKQIIDPSPYAKFPRHPSEYDIVSWTPVYRLE
jgi:hypothetical protein